MACPDALAIRGTIWTAPCDPPRPYGRYVYQRTAPGWGNVTADPTHRTQVRVWRPTPNPNTIPQQLVRARLRAAVSAWRAMSPAEHETWRVAGQRDGRPGYHQYMHAALSA